MKQIFSKVSLVFFVTMKTKYSSTALWIVTDLCTETGGLGTIARSEKAPRPSAVLYHVLWQQALPSQVPLFYYILCVSGQPKNILMHGEESSYVDYLKQILKL